MSKRNNQMNKPITKQQAKSMIKSMAGNNAERKFFLQSTGTVTATASVTSSGTIYSLTAIAQGTTNQTRIGNNAVAKEIYLSITCNPDSTDVYNTFRCILFRWTDDASPTVADVLVSSGNLINSYYALDYIKTQKLQIIYDKKLSANEDGSPAALFFYHQKGLSYPMSWNGTGAIDPVSGGLYVLLVSDSTAGPNPTSTGAVMVLCEQ